MTEGRVANGFGALSSMVGDMAYAGGNYLGGRGKMAAQPQGGGSVWGFGGTGGIGAGLGGGTRWGG